MEVLILLWAFLFTTVDAKTTTACNVVAADMECSKYNLTCEADEKVAIVSARVGVKTGCGADMQVGSCLGSDSAYDQCCRHSSTDCMLPFDEQHAKELFTACSAKSRCPRKLAVHRQQYAKTDCSGVISLARSTYSSYVRVVYDCIKENKIVRIPQFIKQCTSDINLIYEHTKDTPLGEYLYRCEVRPKQIRHKIQLKAVDIRSRTKRCEPILSISEETKLSTCDLLQEYQTIYESDGGFDFRINLGNLRVSTIFWIQISELSGNEFGITCQKEMTNTTTSATTDGGVPAVEGRSPELTDNNKPVKMAATSVNAELKLSINSTDEYTIAAIVGAAVGSIFIGITVVCVCVCRKK